MKQKDDLVWRTKNSLWAGWAFVPFCTFIAFLWIGVRAKTGKWIATSAAYFLINAACWTGLVNSDWNVTKILMMVLVMAATYAVGIAHVFLSRAEYLRRYMVVLDANIEAERKARVHREFMGDTDKQTGEATPQQRVLENGYKMMTEMYNMYQSMPDPRLKDEMAEIYQTAEKIYKYVSKNPDSVSKLRKFNEYYFPEVLKTLRSYQELLRLGESGDVGEKIEALLKTMVTAFRSQLDGLMYDKTLDIRTDIAVLEQMATRDGLSQGVTESEEE